MSVATIMAAVSQLAEPFAWRACGEKIDVLVLTAAVLDSSKSCGGDEVAFCSALAGKVVVIGRNRGLPRVVGSDHGEPEGSQSKTDSPQPSAKLNGMPRRRRAGANHTHCFIRLGPFVERGTTVV